MWFWLVGIDEVAGMAGGVAPSVPSLPWLLIQGVEVGFLEATPFLFLGVEVCLHRVIVPAG